MNSSFVYHDILRVDENNGLDVSGVLDCIYIYIQYNEMVYVYIMDNSYKIQLVIYNLQGTC